MRTTNALLAYVAIELIVFLAIVACAASIEDRIVAAITENAPAALSRIASEIEALYEMKPADYARYHEQLESALEVLAATNGAAMNELERQIQLGLNKVCPQTNPEMASLCLSAKSACLSRFARLARPQISPEFLYGAAKFIGEIRAMTILEYKRLEVSDNVVPPLSSGGPINAGMDPKAITDPKSRAAYERALTENRMSHFQNKLQLEMLPRLNRDMTTIFVSLCKERSKAIKLSGDEVEKLAKIARLSEEERHTLLGAPPDH